MLTGLRVVLLLDAAALFLLGALFIFTPELAAAVFQFRDLPPGVYYMLGLWGCGLLTLGIGYVAAAQDPHRHVVWIQVGIARGALECLLGIVYLARGLVSFPQAGFGILIGALITVLYVVFYPRTAPAGEEEGPVPASA